MGTRISGMTAVLAANLDDTALLEVTDKNTATRKATVAQLRTSIAASAILFLSTVGVTGDFSIASSKFTVASATGNTVVAGTLTANVDTTIGTAGATSSNRTLTVTGGSAAGTGPALALQRAGVSKGWVSTESFWVGGSSTSDNLSLGANSGLGISFFVNNSTPAAMSLSSAGQLSIATTTDSSSTTTGACVISGGLGVAKKAWFGDKITASAGVTFGASTYVAGSIYKDASTGLTLNPITGSAYDFAIATAGANLLYVPTGTTNLTFGASTAVSVSSTLSVTGTSTLTGNVGIGVAASANIGLYLFGTTLLSGGADNQSTLKIDATCSTSSTSSFYSTFVRARSAASMTVGLVAGIFIDNAVKGSGSTHTTQYGLYIENQTSGATNYAIKCNGGRVALSLPTSSAGLASGDLWADSGVVKVV